MKRPRLADGWPPEEPPRVILAEAPAGYGKSAAVREIVAAIAPALVVDARLCDDGLEFARSVVTTLLPSVPEPIAGGIRRDGGTAHADAAAWRELAVRAWRHHDVEHFLIVENAEALGKAPDALTVFNAMLEASPEGSRVAVCTRLPLRLRLGRVAPPHEMLVLRADRLRFTAAEIAAAFAPVVLDDATVARIERTTRGWPMAVLMLRRMRSEGDPNDHRIFDGDELFANYLSDEVLSVVSPATLEILIAAACIPRARPADVAAALDVPTAADRIARAYEDAPFLAEADDGTLHVHPLLQQTLCQRHADAAGRALARAAAAARRAGETLRAAELLLAAGQPVEAAIAVGDVAPFLAEELPPLELGALTRRLSPEALMANPALWGASIYFRRYEIEPYRWLEQALAVWSGGRPMSAETRMGIGSNVVNAYLVRGRLDEAERFLRREMVPLVRPATADALVVNLWESTLASYRGRDLDVTELAARLEPLLVNRITYAIFQHDLVARVHRLRGDADGERAAMARALNAAEASPIPLARYVCHIDAAFTAWMHGDDALYSDLVRRIEQLANPSSANGLRHFLDCARGHAATAGSEEVQFRCWGWLIAASQQTDLVERRRLLALARSSADESGQPYAAFLVLVATAAADPSARTRALAAARALAETIDAPFLAAVATALQRDGRLPGLEGFVERFAGKGGRYRVEVCSDRVVARSETVALSERPREIVTYLALASQPVPREHLLADIWPEEDPQRANATLRTLTSRIRTTTGDRRFVIAEERGYQLGPHVTVDIDELGAGIDAAERDLSNEAGNARLAAAINALIDRLTRPPAWPWFERHVPPLERLVRRAAAALQRSGAPRDRLTAAAALLRIDPLDDTALRLAVEAHLELGDRAAAERDIVAYERYARKELGVEERSPLRRLLSR